MRTSQADKKQYCPTCDRSFLGELGRCPTDGVRLIRLGDDPLLHRTLDGRFRLEERIGAGGMGAVYRATQLSVGRAVAVKVIRAQAAVDESAIKRFLREAQLASRLNHPQIVTIIDFGQTEDNLLYLVMELCLGRSLDAIIREEAPLSLERTLALGIQICNGLAAAHRQEIIHRDLKPSNIMQLDEDEDLVKLLDFGLARSLAGDHSTLTRSDVILGTPTHMAPEVVRGLHSDARSDLYALGVILYTMLSGRVPFSSDSMQQLLAQQLIGPVPELDPAVPPVLARVVARLLEKQPDDRYASAQLACEALLAVRAQLAPAQLDQRAPHPVSKPPAPVDGASANLPTIELARSQPAASRSRRSPAPVRSPAPAHSPTRARSPLPAHSPLPAPVVPRKDRALPLVALALMLLVSGGGVAAWRLPPATGIGDVDVSAAELRARLDALVAADGDPAAPAACRATDPVELDVLARSTAWLHDSTIGLGRPQDRDALMLLEGHPQGGAERLALLARARLAVDANADRARDAAEQALQRCPRFALALNLLGNAEQRARRFDLAGAAYRRALALAPDYQAPAFNLGLLSLRAGDAKSALVVFDETLKRNPQHPRAALARAQAQLMLGKPELAIADLERVVLRAPDQPEAWLLLGSARTRSGLVHEGKEAYCRAKAKGSEEARSLCP